MKKIIIVLITSVLAVGGVFFYVQSSQKKTLSTKNFAFIPKDTPYFVQESTKKDELEKSIIVAKNIVKQTLSSDEYGAYINQNVPTKFLDYVDDFLKTPAKTYMQNMQNIGIAVPSKSFVYAVGMRPVAATALQDSQKMSQFLNEKIKENILEKKEINGKDFAVFNLDDLSLVFSVANDYLFITIDSKDLKQNDLNIALGLEKPLETFDKNAFFKTAPKEIAYKEKQNMLAGIDLVLFAQSLKPFMPKEEIKRVDAAIDLVLNIAPKLFYTTKTTSAKDSLKLDSVSFVNIADKEIFDLLANSLGEFLFSKDEFFQIGLGLKVANKNRLIDILNKRLKTVQNTHQSFKDLEIPSINDNSLDSIEGLSFGFRGLDLNGNLKDGFFAINSNNHKALQDLLDINPIVRMLGIDLENIKDEQKLNLPLKLPVDLFISKNKSNIVIATKDLSKNLRLVKSLLEAQIIKKEISPENEMFYYDYSSLSTKFVDKGILLFNTTKYEDIKE